MTAAEIDADWAVFDGIALVTVYPFDPVIDAIGSSLGQCQALPRVMDRRETDDVFAVRRRWHLRASQLSAVPSIRGEILQPNVGRWRIESVEVASFGTRYVCETVRV